MCRCNCTCDPIHPKERRRRERRSGYRRRFLTKAEKTENLEKYAEDLSKELEAVKEQIEELEN